MNDTIKNEEQFLYPRDNLFDPDEGRMIIADSILNGKPAMINLYIGVTWNEDESIATDKAIVFWSDGKNWKLGCICTCYDDNADIDTDPYITYVGWLDSSNDRDRNDVIQETKESGIRFLCTDTIVFGIGNSSGCPGSASCRYVHKGSPVSASKIKDMDKIDFGRIVINDAARDHDANYPEKEWWNEQ